MTGAPLGGHAVKMIGWGVEDYNNNLIPYWICVNSWNNLWGEGGTFRILRGSNECGIESSCVAGEAGEAQSSNSFNLRKMGLGVDN
jgi:cathepsin B